MKKLVRPARASQRRAPARAPVVRPAVEATTPPRLPGASVPAPDMTGHAVLCDVESLIAGLASDGRPVLVNHWATWCEPCVAEIPALVALEERTHGALLWRGVGWELFSLVGVAETGRQQVATFAEEHGVCWPTLVCTDPPERLFSRLGLSIQQVPQTFLFAADGSCLHHVAGVVEGAALGELEAAIAEATRPASR